MAEEWISVLRLATRWKIDGIRSLAIRQLERLSLNPVDRITLAREYGINSDWVRYGSAALSRRHTPLRVEEARVMGPKRMTRRERLATIRIPNPVLMIIALALFFGVKWTMRGPQRISRLLEILAQVRAAARSARDVADWCGVGKRWWVTRRRGSFHIFIRM